LKSGGSRSKYSEESKKKMSASMKGRRSWKKGLTKETDPSIMEISKKLTGIKRSEETKLKVSLANRHPKPENAKKVVCITNGITYDSLTQASQILGVQVSHISAVCKKKLKHTKGFTFKYL
jgi:hypothetical protein